jgi:hypothetical protein
MKTYSGLMVLIFLSSLFIGCVSPVFITNQYVNLKSHTLDNQDYYQNTSKNKYSSGQIVFQHQFTRDGRLIVNVNNATGSYEVMDVILDASGDGWHTDGKVFVWPSSFTNIDDFYLYSWDRKIDPIHIPDRDLSIETPGSYISQNNIGQCNCRCAIIGSWVRIDGDDTYVMYSGGQATTTHSGKIDYGDWHLIEGTNYTIYWHLQQPLGHRDFYDNITISSDCYSFSGISNLGKIIHAHRL